jgi:hypothetical protein
MRDVTLEVASRFLFLNFVAREPKDYYQQPRESYAANEGINKGVAWGLRS